MCQVYNTARVRNPSDGDTLAGGITFSLVISSARDNLPTRENFLLAASQNLYLVQTIIIIIIIIIINFIYPRIYSVALKC